MDADPLENTPSTGSTQISKEIANPAKWTIGAEKVFSGCGFVTVKSDFMSCSTVKEGKSSGELGYLSCSTIKEARSSGESIMSQRNSQAAHPALEPEELKGWTANLIQYLVSQSSSKHPVKRSDITKDLGRLNSKDFEVVLKAAKKAMAEVLGLNLVALDQGNSKVYILLSSCGPQSLDAVSREERKHVVLLMIVLSFILMSGGVCRETHIWKALQEMNIVKAEKKALHPYFGDVYRLVTQDYVRQLYLEYTKVVAVDPPIHDFRWGKRAELEVSQKAVVEYACEVLHRKPSDFRSIYNEAIRKEQYKGKSDGASTSQQTQALTSVSSSQGSSSQRLLRM